MYIHMYVDVLKSVRSTEAVDCAFRVKFLALPTSMHASLYLCTSWFVFAPCDVASVLFNL